MKNESVEEEKEVIIKFEFSEVKKNERKQYNQKLVCRPI